MPSSFYLIPIQASDKTVEIDATRLYDRLEQNALGSKTGKNTTGEKILYDVANSVGTAEERITRYILYENELRPVSIAYELRDIENFYRKIASTRDSTALGEFLSAAINLVINEGETVVLDNPKIKLNKIGMLLDRGTIIVPNDVGDNVSTCMKGGTMLIRGAAKDELAAFGTGGEVQLYGNSGDKAGIGISGLNLFIFGNSGKGLGEKSRPNSVITITGAYHKSYDCRALIREELPEPPKQRKL